MLCSSDLKIGRGKGCKEEMQRMRSVGWREGFSLQIGRIRESAGLFFSLL
jgi:hypothetical protein